MPKDTSQPRLSSMNQTYTNHFSHAILRKPGSNFADGLTSADLGQPDYSLALQQHQAYSKALESCGLTLSILEPDPTFPDGLFVEDAAIIAGQAVILTNPGAASRQGEVELIRPVLETAFSQHFGITPPGRLDGGDICQAGAHFFIGISERTNLAGALQLAEILQSLGYTSSTIDIRPIPGLLHLKSGLAYLGGMNLLLIQGLAGHPALAEYQHLLVDPSESYAANCVMINGTLLLAAGFPVLEGALLQAGYHLLLLDVSEFQKMDGGLSCLSLRY